MRPVDSFIDSEGKLFVLTHVTPDDCVITRGSRVVYQTVTEKQGILYMARLRDLYESKQN